MTLDDSNKSKAISLANEARKSVWKLMTILSVVGRVARIRSISEALIWRKGKGKERVQVRKKNDQLVSKAKSGS